MPNDAARAMIELIITEMEETAAILKLVRDDHPVEARQRIGGRIDRCAPSPLIISNPAACPGPDPLPDCHKFMIQPVDEILRAVEQLMAAEMLAIRRLCELYDPAAGPSS